MTYAWRIWTAMESAMSCAPRLRYSVLIRLLLFKIRTITGKW